MRFAKKALAGGATAALAATVALPAPAVADQPEPGTTVLSSGLEIQDLAISGAGYPVYRIPALTTTVDGTLIAAYDGRPTGSDLPSHITSLVRRSTDGGQTWSEQQIMRGGPAPAGYGDPSLLVDRRTGRIFLFHAAGINQGFFGSATGNNENDPNVLQTDYSYSDDDGLTWTPRRITAQIKNPAWGGIFAASGQGIQLTTGPYAGRLVQQYVIRFNGGNYAASAYSDDDGETWRMGQPVGPGMDENKSVQLADGDLMLNVRATPYRKVAYSHDGGETWSTPYSDPQLPDPADNGSIIRVAPDADPHDPRSHWLLFSNNDSTTSRTNLTVRMSCDDGRTWPIAKAVDPGAAAYSTLTTLPDDRIGLLYERGGYRQISYGSFDLNWLGGTCASLAVRDGS